jgi:uncharacterized protein YjbI with pentapeptide repeats
MANKPASAQGVAGKLAGKKVAFVGKFHPYFLAGYQKHVTDAGGVVVDAERTEPDYLVIGEGRGGKPPGDVARLQKRYPAVQAFDLADFFRLLVPSREELLQLIATDGLAAPSPREKSGWEPLNEILLRSQSTIDLTGADLRDANFRGGHLERITLDGADLRGAILQYTTCGPLRRVNLDGVEGANIYLENTEDCTFREANLEKAWIFHGGGTLVTRCDFTAAKMPRARMRGGPAAVSHCTFQRADLSGAEMVGTTFEQVDFREADLTGIVASRARFERVQFRGAKLCRADLRHASLVNADLRDVDLREAVLNEANLTGANVEGADFMGAVLSGANLTGVDTSRAKNMQAPAVRVAGPKLKELAAVAATGKQFETSAEVDLGGGQFARLQLHSRVDGGATRCDARSRHFRGDDDVFIGIDAPTFEQGLLNLADRWPGATLRLDTVAAKGGRSPRGEKLRALAVAAWAEVFGQEKSADELRQEQESQHAAARQEIEQLAARLRAEGTPAWNRIDFRLRGRFVDFSGLDLRKANLNEIELERKNLSGCQLQGASLVAARLWVAKLVGANLSGAELTQVKLGDADCSEANFEKARLASAQLQKTNLSRANLRGADLTAANLTGAKLHGADLSEAVLNGANLSGAEYDPDTRLPAGFTPPPDMIWTGPPRPVAPARKAGSIDFATFLGRLGKKIARDRLGKVAAMLKKETFQLFADVTDAAVVGVVRSQSSEELAYSCRLASDGAYCCATQNLKPCGGLRGGLCKHLLVLIVGLAKAEKLDPATVDGWIDASRSRKATLDKATLSETFLRYQSAQEGTVDWRPTETVPEDYYAL